MGSRKWRIYGRMTPVTLNPAESRGFSDVISLFRWINLFCGQKWYFFKDLYTNAGLEGFFVTWTPPTDFVPPTGDVWAGGWGQVFIVLLLLLIFIIMLANWLFPRAPGEAFNKWAIILVLGGIIFVILCIIIFSWAP